MKHQAFGTCMIAYFSLAFMSASAGEAPSIAEIRRVWNEREARIQTVNCEWDDHVVVIRSPGMHELFASAPKPNGQPQPFEFAVHREFTSDGKKCRITGDEPTWHFDFNKFVRNTHTFVFNGDDARELDDNEVVDGKNVRWQGRIFKAAGMVEDYSETDILRQHLRPSWRPILSESPHVSQQSLQNVPCWVARWNSPHVNGVFNNEIWIDSTKDLSIVRVVQRFNRQVVKQVDVEVTETHGEWLPESWTSQHYVNAKLTRSSTARVKSMRINESHDVSVYELVFPPQTLVFDQRTEPETTYLVTNKGSQRAVTPAELNGANTADDVLALAANGNGAEAFWIGILLCSAILVIGGVVGYRHYRFTRFH